MDSYRQALALRPKNAETYSNLGDLFTKAGDLDLAERCYREAIGLAPQYSGAHNNLGAALCELGNFQEAVASFRHALSLEPGLNEARSNLLKCLNYDPDLDPAALFEEHRLYGEVYGRAKAIGPRASHDRRPERSLRIGYVSPDFRTHAAAYFVEPILTHHDSGQCEAYCYAQVTAPDATTERLKALATAWRPTVGLSDDEMADQVGRDRIDILVDLAGHTDHHRLGVFARKPAPVQATYLGYPNTTGLPTVDYLLTDAVVDPPGAPHWSTEEPYRLPGVFCCYAPSPSAPEINALPGLRNGTITFASLHKLSKLNPKVLDLWCEMLRAIPSARLLLFRNNLRGKRRDEILAHFDSRGIAPDRVLAKHAVDGEVDYLNVYRDVDIALDVFPWCGHTTACESLWMGVPIITLSGNRHAGRMTASVLSALGLADWIARTPQEYLDVATRWAGDPNGLAQLRSKLRPRMRASHLCDGAAWVRDLEAAYRDMWRRWCGQRR